MIGMTLCSGIGAPEVAAPWVDWRFASEIEPFPRAVLQHQLGYLTPDNQNQGEPLLWGDMTEVTPDLLRARGIPLPDLVVAGTPCQAFSVAGARKGLADARGNLTLAFVELLHAIVDARPDGRLIALWENVPGVLSDKGNAFGCFLGGLVGALDALPDPPGGGWPGEGSVEGPRARVAWSVLDSQYFGVAQRRRRVFVVVDFGGAVDPAPVLLEPDSLRGDPPARGQAREIAPTLPARSSGGGGLGTDFDCDGGLIPTAYGGGRTAGPVEVAACLTAKGQRIDFEVETFIAHTLRGEGFDASEDGTGRGTPLVPVAFDTTQVTSPGNYSVPTPGGPCHPLAAGAHPPAIAFDCKGTEVQHAEDVNPTLRSMAHSASHQNSGGHAAVAYPAEPEWAVRRLTPTECERLQAFPDDWTQVPSWDGWRKLDEDESAEELEAAGMRIKRTKKFIWVNDPDGPRYKALGNSMTTSVVKWILDRVRISAAECAGAQSRRST